MPAAFREAVWLRDVEEFTYAEIARILDVPVGTVMSRISRGRRQLYRVPDGAGRRGRLGGGARVRPMGILIRLACCREIHRLTTPYVDADASHADLAAVERHLRRCPACQRRVRGGARGARHAQASLPLDALRRARRRPRHCGRGSPNLPAERVAPRASRWRQIAVAAAVDQRLHGFGARQSSTQGSATVLAAQLVADHVKCFFTVATTVPLDPVQVGDRLKRQYGFDVPVPAGNDALGLRLIGARRCISSDGRTAHLLYSWNGESVSLYVIPDEIRPAADVHVMGHDGRLWSRHNRTYVLVSQAPDRDLAPIVAYMQRATW